MKNLCPPKYSPGITDILEECQGGVSRRGLMKEYSGECSVFPGYFKDIGRITAMILLDINENSHLNTEKAAKH
ncbi:hypothetical protein AAMO2058_000463700 [Amorphochlora amoebiformis]